MPTSSTYKETHIFEKQYMSVIKLYFDEIHFTFLLHCSCFTYEIHSIVNILRFNFIERCINARSICYLQGNQSSNHHVTGNCQATDGNVNNNANMNGTGTGNDEDVWRGHSIAALRRRASELNNSIPSYLHQNYDHHNSVYWIEWEMCVCVFTACMCINRSIRHHVSTHLLLLNYLIA